MRPRKYLIQQDALPDGKYYYADCRRWHEKLRFRFVVWLLGTIKHYPVEIKTNTGTTGGEKL